jgi:very-short-patch-repair endonuclease
MPSSSDDPGSLSPRERAGVKAERPAIRSASVYGGRTPSLSRKLRSSETDAEHLLWRHLRNRGVGRAKFRRQQALGPYLLDFYCHEHGLVVEVDGSQHFEEPIASTDQVRTRWLEERGLRVLRFTNREVLTEMVGVLERILFELEGARPSPYPSP